MKTTDDETILTREELYQELWQTPCTKLAKSFGISDVGLAKLCWKHGIPKPPLGYWAKRQFGKRTKRPALPETAEPPSFEIVIRRNTVPPKPPLPSNTAQKIMAERAPENRLVVASTLESPHRLVENTLRSLQAAIPDQVGLVRPKSANALSVAVGATSIDRALRFMDALVKGLVARELKIWIGGDQQDGATYVEVLGEPFDLKMKEHIAKGERPLTVDERAKNRAFPTIYPSKMFGEYPSGQLALSIGGGTSFNRRRWSDKDGRKIELRLNSVVIWLYRQAERLKEKRREVEARKKLWEEEEQVRKREEALERREKKRIRRLNKQVAAWHNSQQLRAYLAEVEASFLKRDGHVDPEGKVGRWLAWGRNQADVLDPICKLLAAVPKEH